MVVDGTPTGPAATREASVFDHGPSETVAPVAIVVAGLAAMAAALGLAIQHRRRGADDALSAHIEMLEPALEG
ncbi:MAG: hypothetical protein ACR2HV_03985 [Acidimicrobiales bacterium]